MKAFSLIFGCILFSCSVLAQLTPPPPSPAKLRLDALQKRMTLKEKSIVNTVPFRSVGPTAMSGRVVDVAVNEADPSHFFVAYASGGLWKTTSNGTSFESLFDKEAVMTIGDIAVNWKENIIWVGTGEVNSSRSSYAGVGMYKSTDGGTTWQHLGLGESHHIGRIIMHPSDPNTVWVATLGHLYSANKERGVYKTTDGGKTWTQSLFVNENAGAIDLIIDKTNPAILYASTWHRERRAWNFVESGAGSGIHKSTDGGATWSLLTTDKSGFPTGDGVGRIGIDIHQKDGKTVLYSIVDNYFRRPKKDTKTSDQLTKDALRTMSKDAFLALPTKKIKKYLEDNDFPEKYDAETVLSKIKKGEIQPKALVEFVEDANSLLFDTPVIGAEIYRSNDEGKTWHKTHDDYLDQVYNSYGYYFGQIRVSPNDSEKIYFFGVPVVRSEDGGKTFININRRNVHVDHHAMWVNPNRDKHLILGNDGGVNISYDDGETWTKCNIPAVGQFYAIAVDNAEPYNIYGGLQDNGVWVGPSTYTQNRRWHNTGHYPYKELMGGDGMQVAIDNRDNNTVYTGFQFGWYFRVDKTTGDQIPIKPQHDLGETPLRFNWQTPIHLSIHNQDILYLGSNKLHRSFNQGNDWTAISGDMTKGGIKGDVAFGTLTVIDESPFQFGLLYVGTDDGHIQSSINGGNSWAMLSDDLPPNLWVTDVWASRHEIQTVYCTLNGYRWDNFDSYVYKSDDFGETWERIGLDLPAEPVNVIKDDPNNPNILYVGTDHGLYISLDKGANFMLMDKDLPAVAVHDIVIQEREQDLVVGTHGRSIYVADLEQIQALDADLLATDLAFFDISTTKLPRNLGKKPTIWTDSYERDIEFPFYSKNGGNASINIKTDTGIVLYSSDIETSKGINYASYSFEIQATKAKAYQRWLNQNKEADAKAIEVEKADSDKYYLQKGMYQVEIKQGGTTVVKEWEVD